VQLFGIDPVEDRFRIRALRATPPREAARDDERRRVFVAALGQFDELLDAAATAGLASRPLPLYYALSQAGTAIAAALQTRCREWRPGSHGLIIGDPDPGSLGQTKIRSNPVKRKGQQDPSDTFSILSEVLGLQRLTRPTTISNVWAAIPGLDEPGLRAEWLERGRADREDACNRALRRPAPRADHARPERIPARVSNPAGRGRSPSAYSQDRDALDRAISTLADAARDIPS